MTDFNASGVEIPRTIAKRTYKKRVSFAPPPVRIKVVNTSSTNLEIIVKEGEDYGNYCLVRRGSLEIPLSGVTEQIKELERRQLLVLEMTK